MVVVNHIVVGQGVGGPEHYPAGPVRVDAVIAYEAAIGQGGRTVDLNPGGMVVVNGGVSNHRAMGRLPNRNAIIGVVGGAVIMGGDVDQLIVSRVDHRNAVVLGVFDFCVLNANEAGDPVARIGNFNALVGDIGAVTDQASDDGVLTASGGNQQTPRRAHWRLERNCSTHSGGQRKGGTPR